MRIRLRLASALGLALLAAPLPALANNDDTDETIQRLLGDPAPYKAMITRFQEAVRAHDAKAVAALVAYPITVTIAGQKTEIPTAADFISHYDAIVTPMIAAGIADQSYDDLFVNWRGVMFGSGEAWINGICRDSSCDKVDIRIIAIQPGANTPADAASPTNSPAEVQPLKVFKNWAVACDNLRNCTALGMISDIDKGAYVKIERKGHAESPPIVSVVIDNGNAVKAPSVRLELDGAAVAGLPARPVKAMADGSRVTARFKGDAATSLIEGLRLGKSLSVTVVDDGKDGAQETVPLAGSAATLLYIDDKQQRIGTVTAMSEKGEDPESSIPAGSPAPGFKAVALSTLADPLPARPEGIAASPADSGCEIADYPDQAIRLSAELTLWGVCNQVGAYNIDFAYWIVGKEKPARANFDMPGRKPDADTGAGVMTNFALLEDGFTLSAIFKGEGIGDCGEQSDWVWDGAQFRLIRLAQLDQCRGVPSDDWPVLYEATKN